MSRDEKAWAEEAPRRLRDGWAEPGSEWDDGHKLCGHRVYIAGLGGATVRAFNKKTTLGGASSHSVELDVWEGLRRGSLLTVASAANLRAGLNLSSKKVAVLKPGEVAELLELQGVEISGGRERWHGMRARVLTRPTKSRETRGKAGVVQGWVSLEARDGTVLLRPDAETQQRRARGTLDTSPVTRQVKLRRKGNRETGWLIWPREEDHLERMRESEGEVSIASSSSASLLEGDAALVVRSSPHPPALHSRGKCAEGWRMGLARGWQGRGLRCGKRAASETSLC